MFFKRRLRKTIITNLHKTIKNFELNVENLQLETGKIHGIVGQNGCGKTVFLKLAAGLMEPDGGKIDYEGITPREITMMFQRPYLMHTTVYKNIVYPLELRKIKPQEKEVDKMLERAGLLGQKNQYARSLSSGERQKLSFMRALIFKPKLVMMDETLSNLDQESEILFERIISEIQEREPVTWIIVNHQTKQMQMLCDRIHYMKKGRFCEQ